MNSVQRAWCGRMRFALGLCMFPPFNLFAALGHSSQPFRPLLPSCLLEREFDKLSHAQMSQVEAI